MVHDGECLVGIGPDAGRKPAALGVLDDEDRDVGARSDWLVGGFPGSLTAWALLVGSGLGSASPMQWHWML